MESITKPWPPYDPFAFLDVSVCVPAQVDAVGPRRGLASCILSFGPVDVFDCGRSPLFASTVVIASFVRCAFALTGTFNIVNLASVVRHGLRSQLFFLSYHFFVTVVLTAFVRCAFALTGTLNIVNLAKVVCHGLRSQLFFCHIIFVSRLGPGGLGRQRHCRCDWCGKTSRPTRPCFCRRMR